ncbi:MAG: hypothetical protein HY231_03510 [Acidobacteria bacterium]|nr:hypothetical protein [Acidobacteriota bacterium]
MSQAYQRHKNRRAFKGCLLMFCAALFSAQAQTPAPSIQPVWKTSKNSLANHQTPPASPHLSPAPSAQESLHQAQPLALLAAARRVYVKSNSIWVKRKSIEDALMKKKGFLEMGYILVKELAEADLKLEVDHAALTLRYPFTVTHVKTQIIVATGTVYSLRLLNDVPGDTADSFVTQAKAARAAVGAPLTRP